MEIFTEKDFKIYEEFAICPNGKILTKKPKMVVRGANKEWRYVGKKAECAACPLRGQCTKAKTGPKMLGVHVYRGDFKRQAARMAADPTKTRDLMGRHSCLSEGVAANLKNHQHARTAFWKGQAMARLQLGLALIMMNTLKWHKVKHRTLKPVQLKPAG